MQCETKPAKLNSRNFNQTVKK